MSNGVRSPGELKQLGEGLEALAAAHDPETIYRQRLERLLTEPGGRVQLGLVRICFEGGFTLGASLSGDILTVTASRALESTAMIPFADDSLRIEVEEHPGRAVVRWLGVSDTREPGERLTPFLATLVEQFAGKQVTVDFRQLGYMNSATVSPIIAFVKALDARGIHSTLLFDASLDWQRLNARSLDAISRMLSHVEVRT